jgi:tRNA-2-methylthio-N6-dimethylallyladenosine synthase
MRKELKRFHIETFGCQMNVNDSEKVAGLLAAEGMEAAPRPEDADFVFINTCAVRERASEKLFHSLGRLRKLKRRGGDLTIGVGGCVPQLQGVAVLDRAKSIDLLVGTHTFSRIPEHLRAIREGGPRVVDLDPRADSLSVPPDKVARSGTVRAYVTAMEGCNHVCAFCVVPRTRGPEVCRSPEAIAEEAREALRRGYREIMILGQTVNSYRHGSVSFVDLLERIHDIPTLERLRFTTSHPSHVDRRLAAAFRHLPKLSPYLHLPVQSGSDRILSSMRRGYSAEGYHSIACLLREHAPDLALSSDVIVGYPGETERDFQATIDLVDAVGFEGLFVFAYSPRPGTTAVRVVDDVPEAEKKRRVRVLNEHQQRLQTARNRRFVGRIEEVLVDVAGPEGRLSGRSPHFRIVHLDGPPSLVGTVVHARIVKAGPNALVGEAVPNDSLTGSSAAPIF